MDISIIVPLYNEAESLPSLYEWIVRVMNEHKFTYEIIFVNDGSTDNSWQVIKQMSVESQKSKVESSKSNPWATGNEISCQMKLNRTIPEISGECFYSTRPLLRNPRGVCESIKAIYSQEKENSEYFLPWE